MLALRYTHPRTSADVEIRQAVRAPRPHHRRARAARVLGRDAERDAAASGARTEGVAVALFRVGGASPRDVATLAQAPLIATLDRYIYEDLAYGKETGIDSTCTRVDIPEQAIRRRPQLRDTREPSVEPRATAAGVGRTAWRHLYKVQIESGSIYSQELMVDSVHTARRYNLCE